METMEWWLPGGGGGRYGELLFNGYKVTIVQEEQIPEICYIKQLIIWYCKLKDLLGGCVLSHFSCVLLFVTP